jgi:AcrR family transcriptional regulator
MQDATDKKRPAPQRRPSRESEAPPVGQTPPADAEPPVIGLRERKKVRTRATIQEHALRLIRERGYAGTTVEQIAAAAEVSPSTFFRYFPTKEDVVLYDATDPAVFAAFEAQPRELPTLEAIRRAVREVFTGLSQEEVEAQRARTALVLATPELRARWIDEYVRGVDDFSAVLARRVGRSPDDLSLRTFAGALIGVILATFFSYGGDENVDFAKLADDAVRQMQTGWDF